MVTSTGRLSSSNPNLQNIPLYSEFGKELRKAFVISSPENIFLSADYSQIELRILAHFSKDELLMKAFSEGIDIHSLTAQQIFGVKMQNITSDMRRKAKAINFGIIYGMSDYGLAKSIGISRKESKKYIENYFNRYPKVKEFIEKTIKEAREIFRMNLYLFSGFALLVIYLIADFWKARSLDKKHKLAHYLLAIWVSSTLLVYVYYFFARGFFPAYALELYPPLIISVSYLFTEKFLIYKTNFLKSLTAFLIVVYAIFLFQKSVSFVPDLSFYFMMTFSLVFIYWFSREKIYRDNKTAFVIASTSFMFFVVISQSSIVTELVSGKLITGFTVLCLMLILYFAYKKKMIGTNRIFTKYFATAVFLATLIGGFGESARYLKINYDSVWSPENARLVKEYFDKNAESDNTLLSGGMIWSIHPKIKPYFDLTHPTAYLSVVEEELIPKLKRELKTNPPDFIVLDKFTQRCYSFVEPLFSEILEQRYKLRKEINDSKQQIKIYKRKF